MANHLRFLGRTVMVQNGNVEAAYGALNRWGGPRWAGGGAFCPGDGGNPAARPRAGYRTRTQAGWGGSC